MKPTRFLLASLVFATAASASADGWFSRLLGRAGRAAAAPRMHPDLDRAPYLQNASATGVTVVWRTKVETAPRVRYGLEPDALTETVENDRIIVLDGPGGNYDAESDRLRPPESVTFQYEARLEGLEPDTTYGYAVFNGDTKLAGGDAVHVFRTYPAPDAQPGVRIWAFGCGGTGDENAVAVYRAMQSFVEADGRPVDLWLHAGDLAYYDGTDDQFRRKFFDIYRPTLQQIVCWPAFGNHDGHFASGPDGVGPYFDAFVVPTEGEGGGVPSGTESYYSFRHGRVHVISLNSYDEDRSPTGRMALWLREDLAAARDTSDWILAFWHHPPYSKGSHDSDTELQMVEMRESIVPILEEGGVDLIVHAHSHTYERSMLIDGAYDTPTTPRGHILQDRDGDPRGDGEYIKPHGIVPRAGMVSVVVGTGGGVLNRIGTHPLMRHTEATFGSLVLDIDDVRLVGQMVSASGEVLDTFGIIKRGSEISEPLEAPWLPFGPVIRPGVTYFLRSMQVRISSPTEWPSEQIHYTLDGGDPSLMTAFYGEPVTITNEVLVRARAWDPRVGHISPVSEARFIPYEGPIRAPVAVDPDRLAAGLRFDRFEGEWSRLPEFDELEAVESGVAAGVAADVAGGGDEYGLSFRGFFRAPAEDAYTFSLVSDDGSRLVIHDEVVADNDGQHAAREVRGVMALAPGLHPVRIDFFDRDYDEKLWVGFETPTMERREVGPTFWFHEVEEPEEGPGIVGEGVETEPLTSGFDSIR